MSDFLVGYVLGFWTCGIVASAAWWIWRSIRFEEPKPWGDQKQRSRRYHVDSGP